MHPSFGRVESQNDGQKLSKLHYKGGNARAVMQKLGKNTGICLILAKTMIQTCMQCSPGGSCTYSVYFYVPCQYNY